MMGCDARSRQALSAARQIFASRHIHNLQTDEKYFGNPFLYNRSTGGGNRWVGGSEATYFMQPNSGNSKMAARRTADP